MIVRAGAAVLGVALVVLVTGSILLQPKGPVPPLPHESRPLETMPDADSQVELAVDEDGITRLRVHAWLYPRCAKTYIVVLDGIDRLRCTAMLPIDRNWQDGDRYEWSTHCAAFIEELARGELTVSDAEVWVENECKPPTGGPKSWQRKQVSPQSVDDATSRSCSC